MAENILAAACESETRKAAKRMRLEIYQSSQVPAPQQPRAAGMRGQPAVTPQTPSQASRGRRGILGVRGASVGRMCGVRSRHTGPAHLRSAASAVLSQAEQISCGPQVTALRPRDKGQDCRPSGSLALPSPSAGRAHRPGQAALPGLRSRHPLHLLTASLLLLPGPCVRQRRPQLQLPRLRGLGQQPAAPCFPPNRKSQ